jgi:hypothetical protein
MSTAVYNQNNLPRFMVGVNSETDNEFLIHCHYPRFIARVNPDAVGSNDPLKSLLEGFEWIDPEPTGPVECARLLNDASIWWIAEEINLEDEE